MEVQQFYVRVLPFKHMLGVTFAEGLDSYKPPCTLILDQATKTGFSLWDATKSLVAFGTLDIGRGENLTAYKYALIEWLNSFIQTHHVQTLLHEETYADNINTFEKLTYIKQTIQDVGNLAGIMVAGSPPAAWRQILARPNKFTAQDVKAETLMYVKQAYPLLFQDVRAEQITEDMVDALGMGIALVVKVAQNIVLSSALKYDKKLPLTTKVFLERDGTIIEQIAASRLLTYKEALVRESLYILDASKTKKAFEGKRQYLTHRDGVVAILIDKTHAEWGLYMLEYNLVLRELPEQASFWLVSIRKRRK